MAGRSVMVRDAGNPAGVPVVYFHGTPGSRLDVSFGEDVAKGMGVRVVSFDRPGYGRSDAGPYSLSRIAADVGVIADRLGVGRFAALGWSGGGPSALAAAAVLGQRVTTVGVVAGDGPFQQMTALRERLDGNDRSASPARHGRPSSHRQMAHVTAGLRAAAGDWRSRQLALRRPVTQSTKWRGAPDGHRHY